MNIYHWNSCNYRVENVKHAIGFFAFQYFFCSFENDFSKLLVEQQFSRKQIDNSYWMLYAVCITAMKKKSAHKNNNRKDKWIKKNLYPLFYHSFPYRFIFVCVIESLTQNSKIVFLLSHCSNLSISVLQLHCS